MMRQWLLTGSMKQTAKPQNSANEAAISEQSPKQCHEEQKVVADSPEKVVADSPEKVVADSPEKVAQPVPPTQEKSTSPAAPRPAVTNSAPVRQSRDKGLLSSEEDEPVAATTESEKKNEKRTQPRTVKVQKATHDVEDDENDDDDDEGTGEVAETGEDSAGAGSSDSEITNCTVCQKAGDDALLLLCDECDTSCHTYCDKPPLPAVPAGDWYCQQCRQRPTDSSKRKQPSPATRSVRTLRRGPPTRRARGGQDDSDDEFVPVSSSDDDVAAGEEPSDNEEDGDLVDASESEDDRPVAKRSRVRSRGRSSSATPAGFDSVLQKGQFGSGAPPTGPASTAGRATARPAPKRAPSSQQSPPKPLKKEVDPATGGSGLEKLQAFAFVQTSKEFTDLQQTLNGRESIAAKFE
jgi:hypothetical protein